MAVAAARGDDRGMGGEFEEQASQTPQPLRSIVGDRTLASILASGARRHPDRTLLVYDDGETEEVTYSWAQMAERSDAVASELERRGVKPGDRIHIHLPNRPEFMIVWFAAARMGASIVPTNTASPAPEVAYAVEHSGATCSVTDAAGREVTTAARELTGSPGTIIDCDADALLACPGGSPNAPLPAAGDELAIMYTSGTTSRPKGVRVTHANYVYAGESIAAGLRMRPDDGMLVVLPLFHANAQYYSTMSVLVTGASLILMRRFSASRYADQAVKHGATVGSLFAAAIRMILAKEPSASWRSTSLRTVMFGQNLSPEELARWDQLLGIPLLQLYGMTETIGPPIMNPLFGDARLDAIGRPTLGSRCRIVRPDGSDAAVGEPGQLLVHGDPGVTLMAGYLNDEQATSAALRDGWFATGDVVRLDPDGLISFVDRDKDMIKRAGENVAASEVESVLREHADVLDACVVGVPDAIRDEAIVAFVVPRTEGGLDEDELIEWSAQRMASFRVPSFVEFLDELPRTAVGKVQKHVLKAGWIATRA
jgi:crotonobetaine/carnitine-CoA ligase